MSNNTSPRVGLFATCLVDLMRPVVGFAAVKLLEDAGCIVDVPVAQTCCGQPAYNAGDTSDTIDIAGYQVADVATDLSIVDGGAVVDLTALIVLADAFFAGAAVVADGVYVAYNALGTGDTYIFADTDNSAAFDAGDVFIIATDINLVTEIVAADFI